MPKLSRHFVGLLGLMIIFRWNGTDLTQFGTVATGGTVSVSGGKIVLAASAGNHNKDTLGFWISDVIIGNRPGMSTEYDWETNDLGPGDGFAPSDINLITNNTSETPGSPTPFPDWRVGLGFWRDQSTDGDQFNTLRDTTHNPNTLSSVVLSTNTSYHFKQQIASDGKHSLTIDADTFTTANGPTTSGGNYAGIAFTEATKNNDFNNTTDPLTVVNAQTNYAISRPFANTGWQTGKYYSLTDAGGNHVEAIRVTGISGNDVTFARGQLGTTATAFPNGRGIYTIPELRFYWQNHAGSITTKYSNVIVTDDGTYTPPTPTTLVATTGGEGEVSLTWSDASASTTNSDVIKIERSTTSGSGFSQIATASIGDESYTDAGLTPGVEYFYKIRSSVTYNGSTVNSSYTSESSAEAGAGGGFVPAINQAIGCHIMRRNRRG